MLRQRVITALLLGPVLLWVVLWAPHRVTLCVIGAAILIGAWEWAQFCRLPAIGRWCYALLVAAALFAAAQVDDSNLAPLFAGAIVWWSIALCWLLWAPIKGQAWLAGLAGLAALVPTWLALTRVHAAEHGPQILLLFLLLIFAADIGAYFAGRRFGRFKLAPRVSPGKTWEGAIGGLLAGVGVAVLGGAMFGFRQPAFMALCFATVMLSIVGDLTESMFKRQTGIKDSSALLPGHGGVLDRIDSITAAAPMFALGLIWMGRL
jgi:phosphatidate cytidylyltransferase